MLLEELTKVNWILPHGSDLKADFSEYKKKEQSKWKGRATTIGARFPIFDTLDSFATDLENGRVFTLSKSDWSDIQNLSSNHSIEDLKDLVSGYTNPRDVDRIVDGISKGVDMPMPIVLKGKNGRWIMSGNTRLNVARLMKVPQKAIEVDVTE